MNESQLRDRLVEAVGADGVFENEPMSRHTTFEIGGPARFFVRPTDIFQVKKVVDLCRREGVDLRIVGLGSDLLVSDEGLDGVVMQIADNLAEIKVDRAGALLSAQAGASNSDVAREACKAGLAGYEFACGIPGTVGGAAIMNAGAYDGSFSDVAASLACLTKEGEFCEVKAEDADWGYRHSRMDDEGMVVVAVLLRLERDDPEKIRARMNDLTERRVAKQPLDMPSAGSTFKRPEGYFAGKLIQDSGMQGVSVGGAQVSPKHAGFIVNAGAASARDVLALIQQVQRKVFDEFQVELEPEVRMWGFSD